jgi:hypothetical protein
MFSLQKVICAKIPVTKILASWTGYGEVLEEFGMVIGPWDLFSVSVTSHPVKGCLLSSMKVGSLPQRNLAAVIVCYWGVL